MLWIDMNLEVYGGLRMSLRMMVSFLHMCEAVNRIPFLEQNKGCEQVSPQADSEGKCPSCDGGEDMQWVVVSQAVLHSSVLPVFPQNRSHILIPLHVIN